MIMNECKLDLCTVYLGYPVWGITLLGWEDDFNTRALLHIEHNGSRILLSGLWFKGALTFSGTIR